MVDSSAWPVSTGAIDIILDQGRPMTGDEPLPPYTYVPGGPWPHPNGLLPEEPARLAAPSAARNLIVDDAWQQSAPYLRGVALFNSGYYWEAHEEWESLWHASGRRGPTADILRALIKLAAAGAEGPERRLLTASPPTPRNGGESLSRRSP